MSASQTIPSICIPRAFYDVTENEVERIFDQLFGVGTVYDVDMVLREDYRSHELYWVIFVHFNNFNPDFDDPALVKTIQDYKKRINNGEEVRIQHRAPYFWKTYKINEKKAPDFDKEEWEECPSNAEELEELFEQMLATAPENCR